MIDVGLTEPLRLAALALCVAHTAMAVYGAFLAAQSGKAAPAWFVKILVTGFGGLNELKATTLRPVEP
eukprot:7038985-Prymnesium_polylepis.1